MHASTLHWKIKLNGLYEIGLPLVKEKQASNQYITNNPFFSLMAMTVVFSIDRKLLNLIYNNKFLP